VKLAAPVPTIVTTIVAQHVDGETVLAVLDLPDGLTSFVVALDLTRLVTSLELRLEARAPEDPDWTVQARAELAVPPLPGLQNVLWFTLRVIDGVQVTTTAGSQVRAVASGVGDLGAGSLGAA